MSDIEREIFGNLESVMFTVWHRIHACYDAWHEDFPDVLPAAFYTAACNFVAQRADVYTDDAFEALLDEMRKTRQDILRRR